MSATRVYPGLNNDELLFMFGVARKSFQEHIRIQRNSSKEWFETKKEKRAELEKFLDEMKVRGLVKMDAHYNIEIDIPSVVVVISSLKN